MAGVLLETCAVIRIANSNPIPPAALAAVRAASARGEVHASLVSAWEVACPARRGAIRGLRCLPDPKTWFRAVMAGPGLRPAPVTPDIAIDCGALPDRPLIAAARRLDLPIVTRDARIRAYAEYGPVGGIPC